MTAHICAWCPDFDPADPKNHGASHGICDACKDKMLAQLETVNAEKVAYENERDGDALC